MADPAERYRDQVDPEHGLAMTAIGLARSMLEGQREQLEKFLAAERDMHNFGGLLEPTLYRDMLHSKSFAQQVRLARASIRPPRGSSAEPMPIWVVRACEESPAEGVREPIDWVLLCTLPEVDAALALRLVDYYALRWRIERFHYTLKSGCRLERLQMDCFATLQKALSLYRAIGDKASEAAALNNVGWTHCLLGDYEQARVLCRQALALCTEVGHHWLEGYVWDSLGYAEHHLGDLSEAAACYQRALGLHREAGDRFTEAEALVHLGETWQAAGQPAQALDAWQQALIIFDDLHNSDGADKVRAMLASTAGQHPSNLPQPSTSEPALPA